MQQMNWDETARAIKEQMAQSDPNEGKVVAYKYTVDGPIVIKRERGRDIEIPHETEEFRSLPIHFKPKHEEMFKLVLSGIDQIKKLEQRVLPLHKSEAEELGVDKKQLAALESFGLIKQAIIKVKDSVRNINVGGRAIIYLSPQGRAYAKHLREATGYETISDKLDE